MSRISKTDLQNRRLQVAELRLRGRTHRRIAEELRISHTTVQRDLDVIEQGWMENAIDALQTFKAREAHRLELVISEAFDAWERSKNPHIRTVKEAGQITKKTITHTTGNAQFLNTIISASRQILTTYGVNSESEINVSLNRYLDRAAREMGMDPKIMLQELADIKDGYWDEWQAPDTLRNLLPPSNQFPAT